MNVNATTLEELRRKNAVVSASAICQEPDQPIQLGLEGVE